MSDAEKLAILVAALEAVRDRNKQRRGLYDSRTQEICRDALKAVAHDPMGQP